MPNLGINHLMSLNYGIDDIVYAGKEQAAEGLPERRNLPPSDGGVRAQLEQLLEKPNTGAFLQEALRPEIGERDLLMPSQFAEVLREALKSLVAAGQAPGDGARVINRAARLLKEETNLRDLVTMYRSALYQG
jgi:type III secretion protein X